MELSVGKVAKKFNLSRTTLLYYDSIGLLAPSGRSTSGYRIYNDSDIERLKQIVLYKDVGVPLSEIDRLISASEYDCVAILMTRLSDLNQKINLIKQQQDIIVSILRNIELCRNFKNLDKESWETILASIGMNEEQAMLWHADLEKNSPQQHQHLLTALGMQPDEIKTMREYCSNYNNQDKQSS